MSADVNGTANLKHRDGGRKGGARGGREGEKEKGGWISGGREEWRWESGG